MHIILGGQRCPTKAALISELAAALRAPDWFGNNWDALVDLLRDRSAEEPLTIELRAADQIAPDDPSVLETLQSIVAELADEGSAITLLTISDVV